MEQLNLFDYQNEKEEISMQKQTSLEEQQTAVIQVGDQVKIRLIDEEVDSELHNYRKYYEPHFIGKVGEVSKIIVEKNGKKTYEVTIFGTVSYFEGKELVWIG